MEVTVIKDSKYLIPNAQHQNFTESNDVVGEGVMLKGNFANIEGLRRGEPFTYKLFITEDKNILYQNSVEPMKTIELTSGADAQLKSTVVNLTPAETFSKVKTTGLVLGAVAGFAYCKYKKCDTIQTVMYIFAGAVIGYASAYVIDRNRTATVVSNN
jgi:hypothetical protein